MSSLLAVEYSTNVLRTMKKLKKKEPQLYKKVTKAIKQIRKEPLLGAVKMGDLKGVRSIDIKHTGTNYELAYALKENDEGDYVLVVMFGTRENFYKELKRYLR